MPDAEPAYAALATLRHEMAQELTANILPWWMHNTVDAVRGGFVGRILQDGTVVPDAPKGAVLNARILWTFAAAYRALGNDAHRQLAERAYRYLNRHVWDPEFGGVYWNVDAEGRPRDTRKQTYAQAFSLYAAAEYYRATHDGEALKRAVEIFNLLERHTFDPLYGGYLEAFGRTWGPLDDVRLSEKDLNAPKSMNTHLHMLEAYTALYRVWPNLRLRDRLGRLLAVFLNIILDRDAGHLHLFFDTDWQVISEVVSFGHDIEASWLLLEAADALGDPALRLRTRDATLLLARTARHEGQDADGGIFAERHPDGTLDTDKHWWPQAEAVVGFLNAYTESGEAGFLSAGTGTWAFTRRHIVDYEHGEWFWRVSCTGEPYPGEDKAGPWKCPYHNARACLEVLSRVPPTSTNGSR